MAVFNACLDFSGNNGFVSPCPLTVSELFSVKNKPSESEDTFCRIGELFKTLYR